MRLGILTAGRLAPELADRHGTYPDLYEAMLAPVAPEMTFERFAVLDGHFPDDVRTCDGWLISGSRSGVLDGDPWIAQLEAFTREAVEAGVPVVGICFGHQVLAEALGGRVEKSPKGWGLGVQDYRIVDRADWMIGTASSFAVESIHQDQVAEPPPGARLLASSEFCPYAALGYDDRAISFQGHPEITEGLARDLIVSRRGTVFAETLADTALATLGRPTDAELVARWIARFLERAAAG